MSIFNAGRGDEATYTRQYLLQASAALGLVSGHPDPQGPGDGTTNDATLTPTHARRPRTSGVI
jgi:hypothetical protein